MRISDLNIFTQLVIGLGIILLLIVISGVITMIQNSELAQQTRYLYDHPLQVRRAVGNLETDIVVIQRNLRGLVLAEDEEDFLYLQTQNELYEADAKERFEVLYDRYLGSMNDIDSLNSNFISWIALSSEIVRLIRQGNRELAADWLNHEKGAVGKQAEMLLKQLSRIDDFAISKADGFYTSAMKKKASLGRTTFIFLFSSLFLAMMIVYLITRNIRKPLAALDHATHEFIRGNTAARCDYSSSNEFGALSHAFNEMADTVDTMLRLNEQASQLAGVMLMEDDARKFCHRLLSLLTEQCGAQIGAVYLLDEKKEEFKHFECIGMEAKGCRSFSAGLFEGEFGAALASQRMHHLRDIPEDTRFLFPTVSGKFLPREIITVPILSMEETVAVISLASIRKFPQHSLNLLETVLPLLNARMNGILAYRKMIVFSKQLEQQNIELEEQKTELSALTNELASQNAELEIQKTQLEEASRLKTVFLSIMSHELRTPLNSVITLSGVLNRRLKGKIPAEEYDYIAIIEKNGKHLLSLINNILDIARIESGREEISLSTFNPGELVSEILSMIQPEAVGRGISLEYSPPDTYLEISTDYNKCFHILQNLIGNAVKFTEKGKVEIGIRQEEDQVKIVVEDTGIGIPAKDLPHIFDEFRQVDSSNARRYEGTGLGLAIAQKYAHLLGGNITVKSTEGEGSVFTLSLPVRITAGEVDHRRIRLQERPRPGEPWKGSDASGKTILIVEDNEPAVIQLREILLPAGFEILVARNGREALEQVSGKIPDGIILDLMMPEMDGFTLLRKLRENEQARKVPVIILTAKFLTKEELGFLEHNNIRQFLQKGSIDKEQFLATVTGMFPCSPDK